MPNVPPGGSRGPAGAAAYKAVAGYALGGGGSSSTKRRGPSALPLTAKQKQLSDRQSKLSMRKSDAALGGTDDSDRGAETKRSKFGREKSSKAMKSKEFEMAMDVRAQKWRSYMRKWLKKYRQQHSLAARGGSILQTEEEVEEILEWLFSSRTHETDELFDEFFTNGLGEKGDAPVLRSAARLQLLMQEVQYLKEKNARMQAVARGELGVLFADEQERARRRGWKDKSKEMDIAEAMSISSFRSKF